LHIPGCNIILSRRDLFDARFQLISDSEENDPQTRLDEAMNYAENPSDIVPGIYEGGLKTWECSLDLIQHLHSQNIRGQRVFEVSLPRLFFIPGCLKISIDWLWHRLTKLLCIRATSD
jgi:hypothetical protein